MDVSHPQSANYGKFWSSDDVIKAFQPSDETVDAVMDWLVTVGGIKDARITHADNKQWLAFDAAADEAEKLLHTTYYEYEHPGTGAKYIACDEYHVPSDIQLHIDYITPGVKGVKTARGMSKRAHKSTLFAGHSPHKLPTPYKPRDPADLADCYLGITPACLRALYNFHAPSPNAKVNPHNTLGLFEDGDYCTCSTPPLALLSSCYLKCVLIEKQMLRKISISSSRPTLQRFLTAPTLTWTA